MRHKLVELVLAGETTHSTDQPKGQSVNPANIFSKHYLKTKPQARLSILILSKTYPSTNILSPLN
jgi:hypothetical protein